MASEVLTSNQWEERDGASVAPATTQVYLTLVAGRYVLDDDPAAASAWMVPDAGRLKLNDASTGAATLNRSGNLVFPA